MSVHPFVGGKKAGVQPLQAVGGVHLERHFQVIALTDVADVREVEHLDIVRCDALALHELPCAGIQSIHYPAYLCHIESRDGLSECGGDLVLDGGGEKTGGGKYAGVARNDDPADPEIVGERAGMQWTCSSHGDEAELARVEALLYGDQADAFDHLGVDDPMDARGSVLHPESERFRDACPDSRAGAFRIEPYGAAGKPIRVQESENQRRVGHARLASSACVAGGTRVGCGGARPHPETSRVVQPGDASAARPDRVHVDHRHPQREPRNDSFAA